MTRGSKNAYTNKQQELAHKIEEGYKERGTNPQTAARIGWSTVNKRTGGGLKKKRAHSTKGHARTAAGKIARVKTRRASAPYTHERRSAAAKKAWRTRRSRASR